MFLNVLLWFINDEHPRVYICPALALKEGARRIIKLCCLEVAQPTAKLLIFLSSAVGVAATSDAYQPINLARKERAGLLIKSRCSAVLLRNL